MALKFIATGYVQPPEEVIPPGPPVEPPAPVQPDMFGAAPVAAEAPADEDPPDSFQAWRTPEALFRTLNVDLGPFGLDAAADAANTKCALFLSEAENALSDTTRWIPGSRDGNVWCNPPYKKVMAWLQRARLAVAWGECARVVMLLNAEPGSKWFNLAVLEHEVHLFAGRVKFDLPPGMKNRKRPAKSQCLVIIEKDGLKGVTAIRDANTGAMLHDLLEPLTRLPEAKE